MRQIWMISDCQCMVDGRFYDNPKPCETDIAEKRAAIAADMLNSGTATVESLRRDDKARQAIIPLLLT